MKWEEINHTHNGRTATVFARSTPNNPKFGESITGVIVCEEDCLALLRELDRLHAFSPLWNVELK